ncbi:hypothetical protein CHS0354_026772 [Potamilus streckersoni]|uniref:Uncharacterized protein n=1 Tax=Potamilus streckersoni TaxID=2493646 RepID=A0AAE0T5P5_9BIVA|nr:hypothetical protein CHS0354_026772 [Potamilus streckersoni]
MPISKLSFFFLKKIFIPSLCLFILLNSSLHSQENPSPPVQRSAFEEYLFGKPIPAQNISVADPKQNMTIPPKIYLKKIQGEGFGLELERFYMQNGETPASYYTLTGADKNDFDPSADAIYLRAKLNATLICGRYEYMFGKVAGSSPIVSSAVKLYFTVGRFPSGQREQTVNLSVYAFEGSNPSLPTINSSTENTDCPDSSVAEHFLGKEKVGSSILLPGWAFSF